MATAAEIVALPRADGSHADVLRHGMGYRGTWPEQSILLDLNRLVTSRGDLSGMLRVVCAGRNLYRGRFNVSSQSARTSLARYLKDSNTYAGWTPVLERFCWNVLEMEEEGPEAQTIGNRERRDRQPCLVDPILPLNSPTILFGAGGSFKSTIAALIAVSVQTGLQVVKGWHPQRGNVMVLDWESGPDEWNDRIVGIAQGMGITPPLIHYRQCSQRLRDLAETLSKQIRELDISLVIVDSVTPAQGPSGDGASAEDAPNRMFDALRGLAVTSLLVDHVTNDQLANPKVRRRPYGSVVKFNRARAIFDVRKEESPEYSEAAQVALIDTKANDRAPLPPVGLRIVHGDTTILVERCDLTAPDLEAVAVPLAERMRRELARGPKTTQELAEALETTDGTIRKAASRSGTFTKIPGNRWALIARSEAGEA